MHRHQDHLLEHVILLLEHVGWGIKLVDQENNNLKEFLKGIKDGERRRNGRKVFSKDFEDLPEGVVLVQNLKHDDYVEILCGSLENLTGAFSVIDHLKEIGGLPTANVNDEVLLKTASLSNRDRKYIRSIEIQKRFYKQHQKRLGMFLLQVKTNGHNQILP